MNIHFKKVRLFNFLSFGDSEVILDEGGYILVRGENNNVDDLATSNGSGKSSIWEGIAWALTGETIRGTKNIVNLNSDGGAFVELEFDIDNNNYRILRSKDHKEYKTNLKIYINGKDKSGKGIRDSEKLLSEYLPDLTSSLIGSVIILGQGLPQRFSNNTPSGRKEVLEKLSKSDFMIADLKDRISNRKKVLSDNLRKYEDNILQLSTKKSMVENSIEGYKQKLEELEDISDIQEKLDNMRAELSRIQNEESKVSKELILHNNTLDEYSKQLFDINSAYMEFISSLNDSNEYKNILEIKDTMQKKTFELNSKKNELIKMQNISDVCPTCGQKLVGVEKPDTTVIENEISELQLTLNKLIIEEQKLNKIYHDIKSSREDEYVSNKKIVENNINIEKSEIDKLTKIIKDYDYSINELTPQINNLYIQICSSSNTVEELKSNINKSESDLVDFTEKIQYNINMKENTDKKLSIVNKMNTIITRDFRGYLLQNSIEFIDRKSKEYSKEVFDTDKLDFKLDGNSISISYDGKEYENLSGGEKQKVDLIVQLSLRDMLCKHLNFSSNIIVLDELFDNLDSVGCQRVLNLIATKLNDVESIFIVTHHSDIAIPVDKELVVIKDTNKISKVM